MSASLKRGPRPPRMGNYLDRACRLGDLWACYGLAEQYQRGVGVPQDPSLAARLYSKVCDGHEEASKFACAALGKLYILGLGVGINFRTGLALLTQACEMGSEGGCSLRNVYGGTGLVSDHQPPEGALGFSFGWSPEQARKACEDANGKWLAVGVRRTDDLSHCDLRILTLDREAMVILEFVNGRLAEITAYITDYPNGDGIKEFYRVEKLLVGIYGLASKRVAEVLGTCGNRVLRECLSDKSATFDMNWEFKDHLHFVTLGLVVDSTKKVPLMLLYASPEATRALGHPGL